MIKTLIENDIHFHLSGNRYVDYNTFMNLIVNDPKYYPMCIVQVNINKSNLTNADMQNCLSVINQTFTQAYIVDKYIDSLFVILFNTKETKVIPLLEKAEELSEDIVFGIAQAEGPFLINSAFEDAEEDARLHCLIRNKNDYNELLKVLLYAIKLHDQETYEHSLRVQEIAVKIGQKMQISHLELMNLSIASLLHDVGKLSISGDILNKVEKLSKEEYDDIKKHPKHGQELVETAQSLESVSTIIRHHHEQWNGTGYPDALQANAIPLLSRIVSVADAYDVMKNGRIYQEAISDQEIVMQFLDKSGQQFDPHVTDVIMLMIENKEL